MPATWSTARTRTNLPPAKQRSFSLSWPEPQEEPLRWDPSLRLVLASQSPQRREILDGLGVAFSVDPAGVEEIATGDPAGVALENARLKAREVSGRQGNPNRVILAADTVVAIDGRILDKPAGPGEAARSIADLAGREHQVFGGIVLAGPGSQWRETTAESAVRFRPLDQREVQEYVATGEWEGRAGGYAIQLGGRSLVESLEGEEENVIGLSVAALLRLVQGLVPAGGRSGDRYNPWGRGSSFAP